MNIKPRVVPFSLVRYFQINYKAQSAYNLYILGLGELPKGTLHFESIADLGEIDEHTYYDVEIEPNVWESIPIGRIFLTRRTLC